MLVPRGLTAGLAAALTPRLLWTGRALYVEEGRVYGPPGPNGAVASRRCLAMVWWMMRPTEGRSLPTGIPGGATISTG